MKQKLIASKLFDYMYVAPLKTDRGISKEDLMQLFINSQIVEEKAAETELETTGTDIKVRISNSAYEGLQEILRLRQNEDCVYVTGSLYLVGEVKGQKEVCRYTAEAGGNNA